MLQLRPARVVAALLAVLTVALPVASLAASDPYRPQQYALDRINASEAWPVSRGDDIVVAVIDSGVDLEHPDLVDRFVRDTTGAIIGRDYVDGDAIPQDRNGHGTMVAGIVAASTGNGVGIAAVAPGARILPVRVLDEKGDGFGGDVDAAIRWAVDRGADVINLSLESVTAIPGNEAVSTAPSRAVQYAWERGVVVVAAAGNSGSAFTDYPPSSPVLLVGATDEQDRRADFSDTGRRDAVLAPGERIISTWCRPTADGCDERPTYRYGQADGTSFSAPHVSGAIAVLLASGRDHVDAVRRLRTTAEDLGPEGPDRENGYGRIDLARAVLPDPEPATPTTAASETPSPAPSPDPSGSPSRTPSPRPSSSVDADQDGRPDEGATAGPAPTGSDTTPPAPPSPPQSTPPDAPTPDGTTTTEVPPTDPSAPVSTPSRGPTLAAEPQPREGEPVRILATLAVLGSGIAWMAAWNEQRHAR